MPLFWFHDSKGLPLVIWSGARAGMQGSMGTLSRRFSASMLPGLLRSEISPLRSASVEMTRGAPTITVISSGAACRYGADGKRFDDTLSREIFHRNVARTIRGGDFSTPLRFGRNDGRAQAGFSVIWGREISPLRFASVEMTREALASTVISSGAACRYGADGKRSHDTLSREISALHASCTIGGSRFLRSASLRSK